MASSFVRRVDIHSTTSQETRKQILMVSFITSTYLLPTVSANQPVLIYPLFHSVKPKKHLLAVPLWILSGTLTGFSSVSLLLIVQREKPLLLDMQKYLLSVSVLGVKCLVNPSWNWMQPHCDLQGSSMSHNSAWRTNCSWATKWTDDGRTNPMGHQQN